MSNVVDTIIKGVDSLFQHHIGFGEQIIIRLATNVYALTYLKETKQMTADIERIGYQRIRDGFHFLLICIKLGLNFKQTVNTAKECP
jgi:hypothetical protein